MAGKSPSAGADAFEKLGYFYLGRGPGADGAAGKGDLVLYESKDLTTHAVCVGMTGSGKTGLCVGLLEEAAIDGIPALVIDPKGDLGNLLLTFPDLAPEDFKPWIDAGEATRNGKTIDEQAAATAALWRKGLGGWGQDGARIQRLKDAADFAIYTPGSTAGLPISILRSFAAPEPAVRDDPELINERISTAVSGLLALLGIDADPVQSREHILLSTIIDHAWQAGESLEIADLIRAVQSPPFDRVGVLDLESVYPSADRGALAMRLNNLLAAPGFATWLEGEPLDIARLLWTETGKPRVAILSIAHLSEAERMFFVTTLLNEVVGWMRGQAGTSSLRAILYMDEVFGYLPPIANPPSKRPMLTLLKQARAYGLGVVLATQNPVDLDYKALSNTGTWFLGRLQTERDKLRVIDGLEGASATTGAAFDRQRIDTLLSGLGKRMFLMNNAGENQPVLFNTRWVLSYLRGPLTRDHIAVLMGDRVAARKAVAPTAVPPPSKDMVEAEEAARPILPAGVAERYLPVNAPAPTGARLIYRPALMGLAQARYALARIDLDHWTDLACIGTIPANAAGAWKDATIMPPDGIDLDGEPAPDATFGTVPTTATRAASYKGWEKKLKAHIYRDGALTLGRCKALKLVAAPDETEAAFRVRVREAAHEKRDLELEKLRARFAPKLARLEERVRKAEVRLAREKSQYDSQKLQTAISIGATVLGALFGRKVTSGSSVGRATTAARGAGRAARERKDVKAAEMELMEQQSRLEALSRDFEDQLDARRDSLDPELLDYDTLVVRPRKTDLTVSEVSLAWVPWWVDDQGVASPAWQA